MEQVAIKQQGDLLHMVLMKWNPHLSKWGLIIDVYCSWIIHKNVLSKNAAFVILRSEICIEIFSETRSLPISEQQQKSSCDFTDFYEK